VLLSKVAGSKYRILVAQQRNIDITSSKPVHQCHEAIMLPNVTKRPAWLMQIQYHVKLYLYHDSQIAHGCFMYHFN
jgi:hypothetical protein